MRIVSDRQGGWWAHVERASSIESSILVKCVPGATALLLVAACSCGSGHEAPNPAATPSPMIHHSSMGDLESDWDLSEVPPEFRGDWRLEAVNGAALTSDLGPEYSSLVFRLAESPADCRVLLEEQGGLREIGTMPYLSLEGGELLATFCGDFHLTYCLRLRQAADGEIVGVFDHAGSGMVYFSGEVRMVRPSS
jgi:hypothetical protein